MYHTLMVDWNRDGDWTPEFGSFDRADVLYESEDYRRSYGITKRQMKILSCKDATYEALAEVRAKAGI